MRRLNLVLVLGITATFLAHAIMSALQLAGATVDTLKPVGWVCIGLISAHIIVTCILTGQTLLARRRSGTGYFRGNGLFWLRRISGLAILVPLVMHLIIFRTENAEVFRLQVFQTGRLISQLLLVVSIALHGLLNIRTALIGLGVREHKALRVDLWVILSVLLLLFAAAFYYYYLRWMAY